MMDEDRNLLCIFSNEYRFNLALNNYERLSFAETSQGWFILVMPDSDRASLFDGRLIAGVFFVCYVW